MSHPTGVMTAVQAGDVESLRILLAEDAARAAARDESGVSAIMHALYRQRRDMADILAASHGGLDIFEATSIGQLDRVLALLQANPDLASTCSADGFTPLHFACFFAQEKMVEPLLRHGADTNAVARNPMKVAPLHSAVAARNLAIVTALLAHGASPNVRQQGGWTPLHSAAQHGDRAMVEILLKHSADRAAKSEDGQTAADLARQQGHQEVAALLG